MNTNEKDLLIAEIKKIHDEWPLGELAYRLYDEGVREEDIEEVYEAVKKKPLFPGCSALVHELRYMMKEIHKWGYAVRPAEKGGLGRPYRMHERTQKKRHNGA